MLYKVTFKCVGLTFIEERLNYHFKDPTLLDMAIRGLGHYDAFRFIGNKLIMLIFADILCECHLLQEEVVITTMDMLLAKKRASDRRAWLESKGDLGEV